MKKTDAVATDAVRNANSNHRPSDEAIAARAYEIFVARGEGSGGDLDDWLQAEKELTEKIAHPVQLHPAAVR